MPLPSTSERLSGEQMYEAWRAAMNRAGRRHGAGPYPRWKDVKPWIKKVWDSAAAAATGQERGDG